MKIKIIRPIIEWWEPFSGVSHLLAALASLFGLIVLVYQSACFPTITQVVANSIFMVSMIFLYTASAAYHLIPHREKAKIFFQSLDQAMIFILIAGTYTPICLLILRDTVGIGMLYAMWSVAGIGALVKLLRLPLPTWASLIIYLTMGWVAMFEWQTLHAVLGNYGYWWLFAGGLSYTVGVIFFILEDVRAHKGEWYYHEIFHIFVMFGSFCHFWVMHKYAMYLH